MSGHISMEDLVAFVWMRELTPEMKKFSMVVNCHLLSCEDCRKQVQKLQKVRAEVKELRRRQQRTASLAKQRGNLLAFPPLPGVTGEERALYAAAQTRTQMVEERELN